MNKKEVLEIRKQFTPENATIDNICGCYVDHEKNKRFLNRRSFGSLSEEEAFKYHDIFRATLSGTVGKNLITMEFPLDQEQEGGTQNFLLKLRDSRLEDNEYLEQFMNKIVDNYVYAENYYIVLIHAVYDIPSKASDGMEMFDASDDMFDFILCSICPVELAKAGLSYHSEANEIGERVRDWVVENPISGFLFPAFNDRNTDIHSVLYYSKKPEELQADFLNSIFNTPVPMTAGTQKEAFNMLVSAVLGEEANYEIVKNLHDALNEMVEEAKDEPDPLVLSGTEMRELMVHSGASKESVDLVEEEFRAIAGNDGRIMATNVVAPKNYNIQAPDIVIKISPERADLVETRVIDNRQCLVIPVDDHIQVNGIDVRTIAAKKSSEEEEKEEFTEL